MHLNATVVTIIAACISPLFVWGGLLPRSRISLVNNEYRGILIAIGEDVPENASLLERLKEIFTNASKSLYRATNKRAFFKEVTILIPKTWSDGIANIPATRQVFDAANVIVTEHEGVGRETPYTNQFGSCGEEAEYIHLTDKFILDEEWTQYYYGDPGKVIVHMWGHLRWGLFDEFARKDDEHFYLDENGNVEPTRCSKSIRGVEYDSETWKACGEDPERNNLPNKHCRFTPFLHNNEGTGSYMFGGFVDSVVEFCHSDVTGDPLSLHNAMAPNQQNIQCSYRSAWDVMLESEDFKNDKNPARQVTDTTPTFHVIKSAPLRIVLVLDVSGSMSDNDRIENLNQMSTKFIMATVPDGHFVGIVLFESQAYISAHLTELQGIRVRQSLADRLPNTADGGTCIVCGLESGIEVLEHGGKPANGGIIMLITDGKDGKTFEDVKVELIGKGVSVDTVAFGDAADPKLSNLSRDTGGIAFLYNEGTNSTGLNDALSATISSRLGGSQDVSVTVASVRETSPVLGSTFIDESIGLKTLFYFLWTTSPISVDLHRPNGDVIDSLSPNYRKDDGKNLVVIEIDDIAEPGEWFYYISGRPQLVEISVLSSPSDKALPIRVMTSNSGDSLISEKLAMVIIYAQVMQGYRPILNAIVVAIVERPSPYPPVQVKLMDNGAGVDITKDDGVYSGVFVDFVDASCPNCRYSIKIIVRGVNGTATVEAGGKKDGDFPFIREPMDATGNETENVGPFVRVVSGGGFEAPMTVPEGDIMPPSRITDLRVLNVSYDQTVSLSWTAPGNDFDRGAADEYDLRYSSDFSTFSRDFRTGINVPDGNITLNRNLSSPNPFGEQETVLVHMASGKDNSTYFFAIRARDVAGNEGAPSNIASVIFARNQMVTTTSKPSTTERSTTSVLHTATEEVYAPKLDSFNALAVGCSVFVVLLLLVLVLGIVIVRRKATKGSNKINGEVHQNPSYEMNE